MEGRLMNRFDVKVAHKNTLPVFFIEYKNSAKILVVSRKDIQRYDFELVLGSQLILSANSDLELVNIELMWQKPTRKEICFIDSTTKGTIVFPHLQLLCNMNFADSEPRASYDRNNSLLHISIDCNNYTHTECVMFSTNCYALINKGKLIGFQFVVKNL